MNDFKDDDFDNFDDGDFDDFSSGNSLKDTWQNNPILKIFIVVAVIIAIIAAVIIFGGQEDEKESRVGSGLDQREVLGGEVSPNYEEALRQENDRRLNQAQRTGQSTIPMLINPEEQELLSPSEDLPPYQEFDPLSTFRANIQEEEEQSALGESSQQQQSPSQEPQLVAPEQVFQQQAQPVPAPSPEAVQNLATAMSANIDEILSHHTPAIAKVTQVSSADYLNMQAQAEMESNQSGMDGGQMVDTNGDGIPDTQLGIGINEESGEVVIQNVIVPAGTINYAQVLIEANSDVPGPVLVQLVSGPLAGARLIGNFNVVGDLLVLNFTSVVVDGINQPVEAIALDPNTTLPGVASEVNQRYFKRVLLPAAARFLEGVGSAIAQDSETTIVAGDTVITQQSALDFEQELGRGAEEAFEEIADFMEEEGDGTQPLVRIARGTPIGVFFLEPVIEENIEE